LSKRRASVSFPLASPRRTHFLHTPQELRRARSQTLAGAGLALARAAQCHRSEVDVMAICGVITTKEVLRHTATIVREFGPGAYLRCCLAIVGRRRTTFLNCVLAR
jgi:hypothetical protein